MSRARLLSIVFLVLAAPVVRAQVEVEADVETLPVVFEGFVYDEAGRAAEGAIVVSSAGGSAVVDARGRFALEAEVPLAASSVQVTAVGRGAGSPVAGVRVATTASSGHVWVDPLQLVRGGACLAHWLPTFVGQPGIPETSGSVFALAVYDDGGGPALHAAGNFSRAGGTVVNRIAKWSGQEWVPLGTGIGGLVRAMVVQDRPGGPILWVGGHIISAGGQTSRSVASWDGSAWTVRDLPLGSGEIECLAVYDDGHGNGPTAYAGGDVPGRLHRWIEGVGWELVGASSTVHAMAVYAGELYAGGAFSSVGGVSANRIARFDGTSWSSIGTGATSTVFVLDVFDDGRGRALYAGGRFTVIDGVSANRIARWDGAAWTPLGSGTNGDVRSLEVFDDGLGRDLYVGGQFSVAGGVAASRIARWDGQEWSPLGVGTNGSVRAMVGSDAQGAPALYAGGLFGTAGGARSAGIARWDGQRWPGSNDSAFATSPLTALAVHDDGSGPALFTGSNRGIVRRWNGASATSIGGARTVIRAFQVHDFGAGPLLYMGGAFTSIGGVQARHLALWNGTSWSAFGGADERVWALASHDDGSGPALFVGGEFAQAGGVTASRIARRNAAGWAPLGPGLDAAVRALEVFDDGGGPALYAGGDFRVAGSTLLNFIGRWDGTSWTPLAAGLSSIVHALEVHDDGSGPALYAGGDFLRVAGGPIANGVARWNGTSWSVLAGGLGGTVRTLASFDDGGGPGLFASGPFVTTGDGLAALRIARWSGTGWTALGGGLELTAHAQAVFDRGDGAALFVGGRFTEAFDSGDPFLAAWGCDRTPPVLLCPPSVEVHEVPGSPPGERVVFSVTASDDSQEQTSVTCVPPSGSVFPFGTTMVECTATDAVGNQATCRFPVIVRARTAPVGF